jgi:hypothetical protein
MPGGMNFPQSFIISNTVLVSGFTGGYPRSRKLEVTCRPWFRGSWRWILVHQAKATYAGQPSCARAQVLADPTHLLAGVIRASRRLHGPPADVGARHSVVASPTPGPAPPPLTQAAVW